MESKEAYAQALAHIRSVAKAVEEAKVVWGTAPDKGLGELRKGIDAALNEALPALESTAKAVESDNKDTADTLKGIARLLAEYQGVLPTDEEDRDSGITYIFGNWERKLAQIINLVSVNMKKAKLDAGENADFKELAKSLAA